MLWIKHEFDDIFASRIDCTSKNLNLFNNFAIFALKGYQQGCQGFVGQVSYCLVFKVEKYQKKMTLLFCG
jgi:hypothetical protein